MSRGSFRITIAAGLIAITLVTLIGVICLNTVIYALTSAEPALETDPPDFPPHLITKAD